MNGKSNGERYLRDNSEIKRNLIRIIQSLPDSSAIDTAILDAALDRALRETHEDFDDFQLLVLDRVLWRFFARESDLWIGCRTPAGNAVSADVLVTSYTMWRGAAAYAENRGVDNLKSAAAMADAVYTAVDDMAKGKDIVNLRKYVFGIYRHNMLRIIRNPNFAYNKKKVGITEKRLWNKRINSDKIENEVLCRELFEFMPQRAQDVAYMRYWLGHTCEEIAKELNTSANAVQKALSIGIQKALEACRNDNKRASKNARGKRRKNPEKGE